MSKLLKLKEWLAVPDAARHLSNFLGEEVGEADVLRLALDGHLALSIFFSRVTLALRTLTPAEPGETEEHRRIREYVDREEPRVSGLWDLVMLGGERIYLEAAYQELMTGARPDPVPGNFFFSHPDGSICVFEPAPGFPDASLLVVRLSELENFQKNFSSLDAQQKKAETAGAENAELRKRIEAVLDYARNRCPKDSKTKMAKHIIEQHRNQGFSLSALKKILAGRYSPMTRLNLDGLD